MLTATLKRKYLFGPHPFDALLATVLSLSFNHSFTYSHAHRHTQKKLSLYFTSSFIWNFNWKSIISFPWSGNIIRLLLKYDHENCWCCYFFGVVIAWSLSHSSLLWNQYSVQISQQLFKDYTMQWIYVYSYLSVWFKLEKILLKNRSILWNIVSNHWFELCK